MPIAKPKKKPKLMMKRNSFFPTSRKTRLQSSGCSSIRRITISFTSSRCSMLSPTSSMTSRTSDGSCCWTRSWTASRKRGGRSFHSRGFSRCMIRSTTSRISPRMLVEDVLDDPLLVELLVEVGRRAELRDPLVDRDRAHLRGARRDDPLPADTALHHARDLLHAARQDVRERREAGEPDAPEAHGVEQHPDAAPVRHVADRAGEERHGDQADGLAVQVVPPPPACKHPIRGQARAQASRRRAARGRPSTTPTPRATC